MGLTSQDSVASLGDEGNRSLMLSGGLAQPCSLARLAVHAVLDAFRVLLLDLENLSGNDARAQIFQVRQQDSKGIEHSVYRKTVLTHFEVKRQHPATYGWTLSTREGRSGSDSCRGRCRAELLRVFAGCR